MRVLLDESLPRQLARELAGYEVHTVRQEGWQGMKNGEVIRQARGAGFNVFITADQNLEYQQNLANSEIGIIVLAGSSNRIEDLLPLIESISQTLNTIQVGQVVRISE